MTIYIDIYSVLNSEFILWLSVVPHTTTNKNKNVKKKKVHEVIPIVIHTQTAKHMCVHSVTMKQSQSTLCVSLHSFIHNPI